MDGGDSFSIKIPEKIFIVRLTRVDEDVASVEPLTDEGGLTLLEVKEDDLVEDSNNGYIYS
jgi:hypothetical protein